MTQPQLQESKLAGFSGYATPAELLLRGMLQREDLRRGVLADVEVVLAEVEAMRARIGLTTAERDRYRKALKAIAKAPGHNEASSYWLKERAREALDG